MSFEAPLVIYDDEDEDALKRHFVELMAAWHPKHSEYLIASKVFEGLRDPELRSYQAGQRWASDLGIQIRIVKARENGNKEFVAISKDAWLAKVLATTEDMTLSPTDKKAKLEGLKLYAESQAGWITKAIDKTINDNTQKYPSIRWERNAS